MKKDIFNKKGVILICAFIFLILLSVISIFFIYMAHTYSKFAADYQIDMQTEFFAQSGIEESITKLYNHYKEGNIELLFKPIFNPQYIQLPKRK